jgi:hypothetical protein
MRAASTSCLRWAVAGCGAALAAGTAFAVGPAHPHAAAPAFAIAGRMAGPLKPGARVPVDLRLRSSRRYGLRITRLTVAIAAVRARAGCSRNAFRALAFRGRYPIRLAAHGATSLSRLGYPDRWWPRIEMADTGANQDACHGARIVLAFSGAARRVS